ncbi:POM121 and ZP3 fusion protein-like [Sinocyclocheilus grahami]|uniref:POM121 and ZP3 fusion protein-like n=1 Tax=Sinocyclocheilus grahami TaxID=75366 RepID=UPI0007AD4266|nr:PREDICTED: POM121 and ZP3 fusion protein-like [Sinocyclocheilus grahami]
MPRTQEDQIRFQLEAFMFQGGYSPSIYITCIVKATLASAPSDALRISCSFSNGWFAADVNHQACGCCDSTCGPDGGNAAPFGGVQWEGNASLGPVMVQERQVFSKLGGTYCWFSINGKTYSLSSLTNLDLNVLQVWGNW